MMKERKRKGAEAFEQYYSEVYGERWETLKESLLQEEVKFSRPHGVTLQRPFDLEFAFNEVQCLEEVNENHENNKNKFYHLDYASFLCAMALPLSSSNQPHIPKILDMCAAPGGKSLILIDRLAGRGYLELNEFSTLRKQRLLSVLNEFNVAINENLQVKGYDGLNYGLKRIGEFDSILLDAPCSSERHVLKSPQHLKQWSFKRPQSLAKKQYGLLCSALLALKPGGTVLYSTCALTPLENDEVIGRALQRKAEMCELAAFPQEIANIAESTEYGLHFLPDHGPFGPLYMCLLRKK